jgi:hypothetical protein
MRRSIRFYLPWGEAAPHKMIRTAGRERLQRCEINRDSSGLRAIFVDPGYRVRIAACITIKTQLT